MITDGEGKTISNYLNLQFSSICLNPDCLGIPREANFTHFSVTIFSVPKYFPGAINLAQCPLTVIFKAEILTRAFHQNLSSSSSSSMCTVPVYCLCVGEWVWVYACAYVSSYLKEEKKNVYMYIVL